MIPKIGDSVHVQDEFGLLSGDRVRIVDLLEMNDEEEKYIVACNDGLAYELEWDELSARWEGQLVRDDELGEPEEDLEIEMDDDFDDAFPEEEYE